MQLEERQSMRINRSLLYAGTFLVVIGGVVVVASQNVVDTPTLTGALRLWPLAVIAIGLALVLRRSRFSLAGGMLAAAIPGIVLGSAISVVPRFAGTCGQAAEPAMTAMDQGTFIGRPSVAVESGCGTFNVRTAPGSGWQLLSGNSLGRMPEITDLGVDVLQIDSTAGRGLRALDGSRDRWELTIPSGDIDSVSLGLNASRSAIDLTGARIDALNLSTNASDVVLDLGRATVADLSVTVNTGVISIHLPAGSDLSGYLRIGGGELQLCAPPEAGLRVTTRGTAYDLVAEGRALSGTEWESAAYASAAFHMDIDIRVTFGTVLINPIGGCR